MGLQLIFVVETDKKCKSDWIYIKDTIDRFYQYDQAHVKLSPIYMGGKGKYTAKEKEILKKKEAVAFKAKKMISDIDSNRLSFDNYQANTSNILNILDQYITRK